MNLLRPIVLLFTLVSASCLGQAKLRKLQSVINHPAINVSYPYISFDGNSLAFISDNSDENQPTLFYSVKQDPVNWKDPVMMPKSVHSRLNFLGGFALNTDGKTLYLSSLKSGGLGGYDLFVSQLKGSVWAEPTNLGLPINSREHEACPSLSPDESTIYFMRCEKMDQKNASECKIFVSNKDRLGRWEDPTELPSYINTGNSQTPRILGDGETLLFSSNKFPLNKGGMDLYMTRLVESKWSQPVPLEFANTDRNDQYVSATSLGRYLLKDQPGQRSIEIVEMLFPEEIKPKSTVKIIGTVSGLDDPSTPYIAVFDQKNQRRVYNGRPEKNGTFIFYLKEGAIYDLSVEPETDNYTFYSKVYDLTGDQIPITDQINVLIKPVAKGIEFELAIGFEPGTSRITSTSTQELRRLVRMLKGNSSRRYLLDVSLYGYISDSLRSIPDLTEVKIDTLHLTVEKQVPDTLKLDSILLVMNTRDSLINFGADSTLVSTNEYFKAQVDSIRKTAYKTILVDSIAIKRTYHNDRTETQGRTLIERLISDGASPSNLRLTHAAYPEAIPDKKRTLVKIKIEE